MGLRRSIQRVGSVGMTAAHIVPSRDLVLRIWVSCKPPQQAEVVRL